MQAEPHQTADPHPLRPPRSLPGQRHRLPLPGGASAVLYEAEREHADAPDDTPLLLVHSINATASAFEMAPLYRLQAQRRPVLALDLPGFGLADKPDAPYTPAQMTAAIVAAIEWARVHLSPRPIDLVALSLGCEFSAQAVLAQPGRVRTLALISPTGMETRRAGERFEAGRTRERGWLRRLLRQTRIGQGLYRLLTTRSAIRWFLARAWGTRHIDLRLLEHGKACAGAPGARHAPLDFVAGALFTRGIIARYRLLPVPVWVVHGTRGAFTSFGACPQRTGAGGAKTPLLRTAMPCGSMPHFQQPEAFDTAYQQFLQQPGRAAVYGAPSGGQARGAGSAVQPDRGERWSTPRS